MPTPNTTGSAGAKAGAFKLEIESISARPNNQLALNDEYREQSDPVEVIVGWKIKCKARVILDPGGRMPPNGSLIWEKKPEGGDWSEFGVGMEVEVAALVVGKYEVRVRSGDKVSLTRKVVITDVELQGAGLGLTVGGAYTPSADQDRPHELVNASEAIYMSIEIHTKAGAPACSKIKQGIIQSVKGSIQFRIGVLQYVWTPPNAPGGTQAVIDPVVYGVQYDNFPEKNDAPLGRYFYGRNTDPIPLNVKGEIADTPTLGHPDPNVRLLPDPNNPAVFPAKGLEQLLDNPAGKMDLTFTDWGVVGNAETNQWVPIRQQQWKLILNNTVAIPQSATLVGPAGPPTSQPSDGTKTSSDDLQIINVKQGRTVVTKP